MATGLNNHRLHAKADNWAVVQVHALLMPSAPGIPPTVAEASQWGNQEVFCADAINATASLAGELALSYETGFDTTRAHYGSDFVVSISRQSKTFLLQVMSCKYSNKERKPSGFFSSDCSLWFQVHQP